MLSVHKQIENQAKVTTYFKSLLSNSQVQKIAVHYGREVNEVIKEIQKYVIILYKRDGSIKEIKHDFLDTGSGIKIEQKLKW